MLDLETLSGRSHTRRTASDPASIERGVRQILADKFGGSHLGLWLLVAEHLRLGTWDLLLAWSGQPSERVEPRLALQLVHEAALCVAGLRANRALPQAGFGLLQGLPFQASDPSVHRLLASRSIDDALRLQRALGLRRAALGHFAGRVLVADPHRVRSWTKRRMRRRRKTPSADPSKLAQTFFLLDADTRQPLGFTTGTASRTVAQATPELLGLAAAILPADGPKPLVLADAEHFSTALLGLAAGGGRFDLMVPTVMGPKELKRLRGLPEGTFTRRWAGYATAREDYVPAKGGGPYRMLLQRFGEKEGEFKFNAFVCTGERDGLESLTEDFPKRWHIEEFFGQEQDLGWDRAGTQNLNVRYGHMTMALVAQAALCGLRRRLGEAVSGWSAKRLAKDLLSGLEGDVRVDGDTVTATYYNAPDDARLREQYEDLPTKLRAEGIDPAVPWLYGYKLDFRFR